MVRVSLAPRGRRSSVTRRPLIRPVPIKPAQLAKPVTANHATWSLLTALVSDGAQIHQVRSCAVMPTSVSRRAAAARTVALGPSVSPSQRTATGGTKLRPVSVATRSEPLWDKPFSCSFVTQNSCADSREPEGEGEDDADGWRRRRRPGWFLQKQAETAESREAFGPRELRQVLRSGLLVIVRAVRRWPNKAMHQTRKRTRE